MQTACLASRIASRKDTLHVQFVPGKGRAVFASKDLKPGDLVSEEQATTVISNGPYHEAQTSPAFPASLDRFFEDSVPWPSVLDDLVSFVGPQSKADYLSACSAATVAKVGRLEANQFDLPSLDAIGLFAFSAMFNHSCFPTCVFATDGATLRVFCRTHVKQGEELTIQYGPSNQPVCHRVPWMEDAYGFSCDCLLCCNGQSDIFRAFLCDHCADPVSRASAAFYCPDQWTCGKCGEKCSASRVAALLSLEASLLHRQEDDPPFAVFLARDCTALAPSHHLYREAAVDAARLLFGLSVEDRAALLRSLSAAGRSSSVLGPALSRCTELWQLRSAAVDFMEMAAGSVRTLYAFAQHITGRKYYAPELASLLITKAQYAFGAADAVSQASPQTAAAAALVSVARASLKEALLLTRITHGTMSPKYILLERMLSEDVSCLADYARIEEAVFSDLSLRYCALAQSLSQKEISTTDSSG